MYVFCVWFTGPLTCKKNPDEQLYRICYELTVKIKFTKRVLKNVIMRAFGKLNNTFQNPFNIILSQQSTNVRFVLSDN